MCHPSPFACHSTPVQAWPQGGTLKTPLPVNLPEKGLFLKQYTSLLLAIAHYLVEDGHARGPGSDNTNADHDAWKATDYFSRHRSPPTLLHWARWESLPSSSYVNLFLSERTAWYSSPEAEAAAVNNA